MTILDYEVREVREGDLSRLHDLLRGPDRAELIATYGTRMSPDGLQRSVDHSAHSQIIIGHSGDPMFLFGYADWTPASKLIWACGSPEITRREYQVPFLKASRRVLKDWFEDTGADYMMNLALATNTVHLRWLQWCHAELLPALPYGPLLRDFHPFIIRRSSYV